MSTSPKEGSPAAIVSFTEKEERVLKLVWQCLKTMPEVDLEKLRVTCGFNTAKNTSNTWGTIKKKLQSMVTAEDDATETSVTKATPTKRKKAAVATDADGEVAATPSKKRKTPTKKKATKAPVEDAVEKEQSEEEGAVKKEAGDDE
ncbi:hypothetical protein Q7P37_003351 [Cladosporium fusiforme]